MAYYLLDKKTRARVDELIRRHPDYARFSEGVGGKPQRIARWAPHQLALRESLFLVRLPPRSDVGFPALPSRYFVNRDTQCMGWCTSPST